MKDKHIAIIGSGAGGLTAAMILAKRGFRVSVFEKEADIGGRNRTSKRGPYVFDTGPTFLMMDFILREMFEEAGARIEDHLDLKKLDPMYKLTFNNIELETTSDRSAMKEVMEHAFPGSGKGLENFYTREKIRYDKMYPCLQVDYCSTLWFLYPPLLKALPHLSLGKSIYQVLGGYFDDERARISFTFQAKYLGMSPWNCPGAFTIIPYIEHSFGIYHVTGGLSRISEEMARIAQSLGATITLSTPVERISVKTRTATGVVLKNGEKVEADAVVINADFAQAMTTLFDPGLLHKYTPKKVSRMKYSCSTFMIYIGLDILYDEPHHNIIIAEDYKTNIEDVSKGRKLSDDLSVYVRNASVTDPTLAPAGHSAIYILVPVPNTSSGIRWDEETTSSYYEKVLDRIAERTSMKDIRSHIVEKFIITPDAWQQSGVYNGATFNLAHTLTQMLYLRPHNRFEEIGNCYLVGGGTHPGSGLPTIYESARISANLICKDMG